MKMIKVIDGGYDVVAYNRYLAEIESRLPDGARTFMCNAWHYDPEHHHCPHDSWVEHLLVREISSGHRREVRHLQIEAKFLGAYHDGTFTLIYDGVENYSFNLTADTHASILTSGHSDWHVDEMLLEGSGAVTHEVLFHSKATWKITCRDVAYRWSDALPG
jgi:hypothetical protein